MRRTCVRCGVIQHSDLMHFNKQQGWLCDNRKDCTLRLLNDSLDEGNPVYAGDRKLNVFEMVHLKAKIRSEQQKEKE